jgi:Cu+-exporting ATPase
MNVTAYMIAFDDQHRELVFPVDSGDLRDGDLLLLNAGETIPRDCKLLTGEVLVGDQTWRPPAIVPAGGVIIEGSAKAYVVPA